MATFVSRHSTVMVLVPLVFEQHNGAGPGDFFLLQVAAGNVLAGLEYAVFVRAAPILLAVGAIP